MTTETTTEDRGHRTRRRGPLTWALAAVAVLVIVVVTVLALKAGDDATAPPTPGVARGTVTELGAPTDAAYAARCMVPDVKTLAGQQQAFDGTVTSIDEESVTLTPTRWYAGDETDQVRVDAPPADLSRLLGAVEFRDGERYLVSASDGRVSLCGLSGPYTPRLASLYRQAFAG